MLKRLTGQSNRFFPYGFGVMLMFFAAAPAARALDIVWVSQNTNDASFITALTNAGHNVSWDDGRYATLSGDKITELNAADLVIVSRNTDSGTYSGGTEPILWNGLATRLLLCSGYLARNVRWNWLNGDVNTRGEDQIVVDADDPAYAGLAVSNGETTDAYSLSVNSTAATDAGNGTLVAKADGATPYVMLARWPGGTEYYAGCVQTAGAERVYFPASFDYSELTAFGESVFHNIVNDDDRE